MGQLFLLGNGFDIGCGLNCSYEEIYREYIKTSSKSENIANLKKDIGLNVSSWGDYEMGIAKYAEQLNSGEQLQECVRDMKEFLQKYLGHKQMAFNSMLEANGFIAESVVKELQKSFYSYYKDISSNVNRAIEHNNYEEGSFTKIITFNYTNILDNILKNYYAIYSQLAVMPELIHIHGTLDNKDIALGVDNETQINVDYKIGRKIKRSILKPYFNKEIDESRIEIAKRWIESSLNICCFGMSLGDSDLMWRELLIDAIKKDERRQLFIYQYDLFDTNSASKDELLDIGEDRAEEILNAWGINDVDSMIPKIHIPCGKRIFNIEEAIEQGNLKMEEFSYTVPTLH